jgi:hypothetical protein
VFTKIGKVMHEVERILETGDLRPESRRSNARQRDTAGEARPRLPKYLFSGTVRPVREVPGAMGPADHRRVQSLKAES